jgi:hypothetical protein
MSRVGARVSKLRGRRRRRTPGEHSHPGASQGGTLAEILRHSGDRTPGSHLVRSRADDHSRGLGGERGFARASKVMGVEAAAEGQHGPRSKGAVTADGVCAGRFGRPRGVHPTSRVSSSGALAAQASERCPEHGDPGVARRAERRAVPAGGGTPPAVAGRGPQARREQGSGGARTPRRAPASARRVTAARCERTRAGKNASRSTERPDRGGSGGRGPG